MDFRSSSKIKVEGAMSSMTDLVFLMLIFFVILSTLVSSGHNIELPNSSNALTKEKGTTKVYVNAANQYFVGESNDTPIEPEQLEQVILSSLGLDSTVEVLADKTTDWEYSIRVIDIAKKHGCKLIIKTKSN